MKYIEIGKKQAKLLLGGERLSGPAFDRGYYVAPTIFDHVAADSTIAQEEIFGPVLSVIRVRDFDEALRVANSVRYGLSSSLYTNDAAKIFEFIDRIETGITDRKSTRLNSSHSQISYAVFCLKKKKHKPSQRSHYHCSRDNQIYQLLS